MIVDKRAVLLDAAERAILADGYVGASTRRIVQEAGVPLSLLHYYFGGKEGLLVALVERARDRGRDAALGQLAGEGPPLERVEAALRTARDAFLEENGAAVLLLEMAVAARHNERLHAEVERLYLDGVQTLSRTIERVAVETGLPPGPIERPEAFASLILAAGYGLALQRMLGVERRAAEEAFDALGRLLLGRLADAGSLPTSQ